MRSSWFASLVILATVGCSESAEPASSVGVTLTLTVSSATLPRGQPDTVTMTVTNTGSWRVTLTGGACEPQAQVINSSGEVIVPPGGEYPCVRVLRRLELALGQRYIQSFVWNTDTLPSGTYRVSATFASEQVQLATVPIVVQLN